MTLKTKLTLGLGFLFALIFTLGGFCSYYVGKLGQESDNILKNNYKSIVYSRNMLSGLGDMRTSIGRIIYGESDTAIMSDYNLKLFESGKNIFETNLKDANNNITEINEKEYVEALNHEYERFLKLCLQMQRVSRGSYLYFSDFLPAYEKLKQSIDDIYDVNMQAVMRKSELAKHDSARFNRYMAMIGAICLVLALGYFWYFPTYISLSLSYLSDKMKNLLKNNGISFDIKTKDEADVILQGINLLENKLGIRQENVHKE
jgi:NtrC-family two-component system sensor histidine kinase KinB